jgi:hypothetical protein
MIGHGFKIKTPMNLCWFQKWKLTHTLQPAAQKVLHEGKLTFWNYLVAFSFPLNSNGSFYKETDENNEKNF